MSTLAEIEQAVESLPRPEQETLWQHLSHRLFTSPRTTLEESEQRQNWLAELRAVRERNATGKVGTPLQQVMDELREERA